MMTTKIKPASEIEFRVVYHWKGYIRIALPEEKKLAFLRRINHFRGSSLLAPSEGIKHILITHIRGDMVMLYEPEAIDIINYLESMISGQSLQKNGGTR